MAEITNVHVCHLSIEGDSSDSTVDRTLESFGINLKLHLVVSFRHDDDFAVTASCDDEILNDSDGIDELGVVLLSDL